jgi:hypothetical protein
MIIGITSNFAYSFWSNGLNQNIVLLYEAIEKAGFTPVFIDWAGKELISHKFLDGKKIIPWDSAREDPVFLDILLCPAISSNEGIKQTFHKKNPKCKIIGVHYGNNLFSTLCEWFSNEPTKIPDAKYMNKNDLQYEETWVSPHYYFAKDYYKVLEGGDVSIMPYIWHEKFIAQSVEEEKISKIEYIPVAKPNIVVVEPNINVTKNFYIPLLSIIHLLDTNPNCFNTAVIYGFGKELNTEDKEDIGTFLKNTTTLADFKNKVFWDTRIRFPHILNDENPILLSHQHYNALNYTYLEALHYNYPLVHNSPYFKDAGYFYEGFDCISAAEKILYSINNHNDNLEKNKQKNKLLIDRYHSDNPENINSIKKLIESCVK